MNPIFKTISSTVTKDDESSQPLLGRIPQVNPPQLHMPEAPKMPKISTPLKVPEMPQAPKMPEVSQTIQIPRMPDGPQIPQSLATVTTPLIDIQNIPKSSALSLFKSIVHTYLTSGTQKQAVISLVIIDLTKSLLSIILAFVQTKIQGTFLERLSILFDAIRSVLASVGSLISNAFILELVASWWVFGWRYFTKPYHMLDLIVVLITFISGLLPSVVGEIMSLAVILRAWRLFTSVRTILLDVSPVQILPNAQV